MTVKFRHTTGTKVAETVVPKNASLVSGEVVDDVWLRRIGCSEDFFQSKRLCCRRRFGGRVWD
jgi:hypothetical protein